MSKMFPDYDKPYGKIISAGVSTAAAAAFGPELIATFVMIALVMIVVFAVSNKA